MYAKIKYVCRLSNISERYRSYDRIVIGERGPLSRTRPPDIVTVKTSPRCSGVSASSDTCAPLRRLTETISGYIIAMRIDREGAAYLSAIPRRSPFSRLPAGHAGRLAVCRVPLLSPVGGLRPRVSRAPCGGALPAASSTARATPRRSYEDARAASVRLPLAIVSPYRAPCVPHEDG